MGRGVAGCWSLVQHELRAWSLSCCGALPVLSPGCWGCGLLLQGAFQVCCLQDRCPEAASTLPLISLLPVYAAPMSGQNGAVLPSPSPGCWRWLGTAPAGSVSLPALGRGSARADQPGGKDSAGLGPPRLVARWGEKVPMMVFWGVRGINCLV